MRAMLTIFISIAIGTMLDGTSTSFAQTKKIYTSPDGVIDIVVAEIPAMATVSTPYVVSLVPHGRQPRSDDTVLKIDRAAMPTAAWSGNSSATIRCTDARVWDFRNFWQMKTPQGQFRNVAIALACGQAGYSSPLE